MMVRQLENLKEHGKFRPSDQKLNIVPGAIVFQSVQEVSEMAHITALGTIAFILEEEALVVRVSNGWQYIALGSVIPAAATVPPPAASSLRPPIESSNLINSIPYPVDGPSWFPKMLRLAALNEPYDGNLGGVRGADYKCYREARRLGIRATFRALLSGPAQNLDSIVRFSDREFPIINIKGDVLFSSWKEMFNGDGAPFASPHPRIFSFSGKNILTDFGWPQKMAWHGSRILGERAMDANCAAWNSGSSETVGIAGELRSGLFLGQTRFACTHRLAVFCIEATTQTGRRRRNVDNTTDVELSEPEYHNLLEQIQHDV